VGDEDDSVGIERHKVVEEMLHAVDDLPVGLSTRIRDVKVPASICVDPLDRSSVPLPVVAFAQAGIRTNLHLPLAECDLGRIRGPPQIGCVDDIDDLVGVPLAELSSLTSSPFR
jgi:hypothetical protein